MPKRTKMDELALIGLLWRDSTASPRSGISTRSVTTSAVELADREGLDAVTIRRIAELSGVTSMALYPHIGGRGELLELMLDSVAGTTYAAVEPPEDADWRARVIAIAEANWANCQTHPWITDLAIGRGVPGPGACSKYETELRALDGIGLSDVDMDHTLTALLALVHGTARAAIAVTGARESDEEHDTSWWSSIEPAITAAIGDRFRFATAARVSRSLGAQTGRANDPEGAYRRGVDLLIDGIARKLDTAAN